MSVLTGDAGKEVLVAARRSRPTSCGNTGPTTSVDVVLDHRAVDPDVDAPGSAARPTAPRSGSAGIEPSSTKVAGSHHSWLTPIPAQSPEVRRELGASVIAAWVPSATSTVSRRDPPVERPLHGAEQQRQRAAAGAVGHDHADAAPVQVDRGELLVDERVDLLVGENLECSPDQRHGSTIGRCTPTGSCPRTLASARSPAGCTSRSRELPLISPHGHVDPRLLLDDEPFADPTSLLITPDHYVTRLLHASGVAARSALEAPRGRAGVAAALRALGRLPRHARALLARVAARRDLRRRPSDRRRRPTTRSRRGSPRTPSARARCSSASTSRCSPPPTTRATTSPHTPRSPPTRPGRARRPDVPARSLPRARRSPIGRRRSHGSPKRPTPTPATTTATSQALESAAPVLRRARRGLRRPQPRRRAHRSARAGGRDPDLPRRAGRPGHVRRGHGVPPPHAARDGADVVRGRPGDDAAPRRPPQPPPADGRALRPDTGHDIPVAARVHRRAAAAARALRHRTRASTWCCSPSTRRCSRASSRRWPASTPRVYVGAPWWFLDAPDAIRRFRAAVTETAGFCRTSGFVDDTRAFCSIPARHDMSRRLDAAYLAQLVAEHRLDEDEAARSPRPGRRPGRLQAVTATRGHGVRKLPAAPVRIVHLGLGNFFRAHQAWYTDRAPTPRLGHRRLHRPQRRGRDLAPRTASTRW